MLNTFLLSLAVALWGCGGGDDTPQPASVSITVSPETVNAPAEGGTYTVNVSTTGKEWGVGIGDNFFKVETQNTAAQAGTITIKVPANPVAEARTGAVTVMSGAARKTITVTQAAAEQAAYDAPEGYKLVWQDEFNEGTELNPADWTHEVQPSGWVNHELQNYVNHTTPKGKYVTEVMGGTLRIHCFKEDGKVYSGRVYAKVKQGWQYGYIEASIKLPKGKGTWPAFWMMPVNFTGWPDSGEIDIMEEVADKRRHLYAAHLRLQPLVRHGVQRPRDPERRRTDLFVGIPRQHRAAGLGGQGAFGVRHHAVGQQQVRRHVGQLRTALRIRGIKLCKKNVSHLPL